MSEIAAMTRQHLGLKRSFRRRACDYADSSKSMASSRFDDRLSYIDTKRKFVFDILTRIGF
jgi:hypothetical protein